MLAAPEEVRNPADVALGQRELQVREVLPELGPDQFDERVHARYRRAGHHHARRCVHARTSAPATTTRRACTARCRCRTRPANSGIPVVGVDARHVQRFGVLRERHGVTTLVRQALDLLGGLLDVEQRQDAARDEPARVGAAPFVDVPVVVRLDHDQVDVAVGPLVEHLAGKAGPVRKVQAGQQSAGVHVADPLVDVEAAGAHLVVARGVDVVHLARLAGHGVEPEVATAQVAVVPLLLAARPRRPPAARTA